MQKQPFADVFQNRCSFKFGNVRRKTPVLELLFNIVPGMEDCSCITKRFQHKYFLVSIVKILRTPILKDICKRLLLYICRPLLNQKHNIKWFLLRSFVDLVSIYFLLIVSRNHPNRVNTVLISGFWQIYAVCYQLHNAYFNMQINRWWNFKDKMVS